MKIITLEDAKKFLESLDDNMYTSTHTHAYDLFDSMNENICEKFKLLNAKGFVLTQHGVMSGTEIMRKKAQEYGLKFVPGIEAYYKKEGVITILAHLIIISKDDQGYHAICMAVSDAQDKTGKAVMTDEILEKYFGEGKIGHKHVFATSACIQGVCGIELRNNQFYQREIDKIAKRSKFIVEPEDKRIASNKEKIEKLEKELAEKVAIRDQYKKSASVKFTVREKNIEKLRKAGDPSVEERVRQLENDKKIANEANELYKESKKECDRLRNQIKAIKQEQNELEKGLENYYTINEQTTHLREMLLTEEEMRKNAEAAALKFEKIFGKKYFFMEMQYHGIEDEKRVYPILAEIAEKNGIPVVCSNDIHIVDDSEPERLRRQIMRSLRFGSHFEKENVGDDQLYPKSDKQLAEWLLKILDEKTVAKAIANTRMMFDLCNVEFKVEPHYPVYDKKNNDRVNDILDEEIQKGIKWRFPDGFPDERYRKRIEYESNIIKTMGYANYHLVVKDFLELGRALESIPPEELDNAPITYKKALRVIEKNPDDFKEYEGVIKENIINITKKWVILNGWRAGIGIGPGRGSAVGSLVCYVLGITSLDPLKYDLLFERFLNPERVSMPDIDSDIAKRIRPYVIEYVRDKYGEESVCGIITTNAIAPRGSVRTAAKYYDLSIGGDGKKYLSLADKIAKKVPNEPGTKFDKVLSNGRTLYEELQDYCENLTDDKTDALEILKWAKIIEGLFTAYGAHAAGIVIGDGQPIKNFMPLRWNEKLKEYTTQYDMVSTEENGHLKMDFLGLRTLDIETDCLKEILKQKGKTIDLLQIPLDDRAVYEQIFQKGRTNNVFQCESSGMKNMLKRFKPTCFEDLIILVSMYRPGPMQYLNDVIEVKNGKKKAEYLTPQLKPILEKTYGAIIYQEQVMEIFQKLAGYTLGGADQVRRFMSKKKHDKLEHERDAFIYGDESRGIVGCVKNGIGKETANKLFDQMTDFASYAFNKSHAAAYAFTSYTTAWLKLYYPSEFIMAAMNWAEHDKLAGLMNEAKSFGITVKAPDINISRQNFSLDENEDIVFGFGSIKNVGAAAAELLKDRRLNGNYATLKDFFERVKMKKDAMESMIKAGCFDRFCENRKSILKISENAKKMASDIEKFGNECDQMEEEFYEVQIELEKAVNEAPENIEQELKDCKKSISSAKRQIKKLTKELEKAEESGEGTREITDSIDRFNKEKESAEGRLLELNNRFVLNKKLAYKSETLERAQNKYDTAVEEFEKLLQLQTDETEDKDEKAANEREVLGSFVTISPLDDYPSPEKIGALPIDDLSGEDFGTVIGIAMDLQEKKRKKDNKPMLFFTLEDGSGQINVCLFTIQYEKFAHLINEGKVYVLKGKYEVNDEERKFYVEDLEVPEKELVPYMMSVESFALWHMKSSVEFENKYRVEKGHGMYILDKSTGKLRTLKYPVKDSVRYLDSVMCYEEQKTE